MIDKSSLTKLCTIVRAFWCFIVKCFQELKSYTADDLHELSNIFSNAWKNKDAAYNTLVQDGNKDKRIPLKQGILSLPGRNSRMGEWVCMLFISSILGVILGGSFGVLVLFGVGLIWGGLILIVIFIFLLLIIPILNHQADNYYLGYLGERVVAEELDNLVSQHGFSPRQWHFFHSFFPEERKKGDIDHVIVCPKGIFCVETKAWRKKKGIFCVETKTWRKKNEDEDIINFKNGVLTINNFQHDEIIEQVEKNAQRMRYFLEEKGCETSFVKSIITFPLWWHESDNLSDATIFVINPERFHLLSNKPDTLSQEQIDKISQVIKDRDRTSLKQLNEMLS